MSRKAAEMKLVTNKYGHAHWADPQLVRVIGGYALGAARDFGGRPLVHYFGPDPAAPGQLHEVAAPYVWPTAAAALAALAALDAHPRDDAGDSAKSTGKERDTR
jgi:hypothetical protein